MTTTTDPRQEWRTPKEFLEAVQREFGALTIDVAASAENAVCKQFLDRAENGLMSPWFERGVYLREVAWCNPGFSSMPVWIHKACVEVEGSLPTRTALVLGLCAPSTAWWRHAISHGADILLLSPRIQFDPAPGVKRSSNPRECALFVFRDPFTAKVYADAGNAPQILTWWWKERLLGGYGR
jgi:phage N-6-adenine-methyltransferase